MEMMFSGAAPQGREELFHEVYVFGAGAIFLSCVITRLAREVLAKRKILVCYSNAVRMMKMA